jgi:hypothetical protein
MMTRILYGQLRWHCWGALRRFALEWHTAHLTSFGTKSAFTVLRGPGHDTVDPFYSTEKHMDRKPSQVMVSETQKSASN